MRSSFSIVGPAYSHVVLSSTDGSDFLSLAALRSACGLDILLRENLHFSANCQTSKENICCVSWTLHNYIAVLHGHTNCLQITVFQQNPLIVASKLNSGKCFGA